MVAVKRSTRGFPHLGGTPILATMKIANGWKASLVGDAQRNVHFDWVERASRTGPALREFMAHEVRAAFLSVKSDDEAIGFFNKYGPFQGKNTTPIAPGARYEPNDFALSRLSEFQEIVIEGLLLKPSAYTKPKKINGRNTEELRRGLMKLAILDLLRPPTLTIHLTDPPYLFSEVATIQAAVSASVYIDKIARLEYGQCEECKEVFLRTSGHTRRFCDKTCGGSARKARYNVRAPARARKAL